MLPKVLPIQGYKSLRVLNGFNALLLGLKMLPAYASLPYEEFYMAFEELEDAGKESLIREAVMFVKLEEEEVEAMISFCSDPNGVPYSKANVRNLKPDELHACIVSVCLELSRFKIDIVSESEKKNYRTSQSTFERRS